MRGLSIPWLKPNSTWILFLNILTAAKVEVPTKWMQHSKDSILNGPICVVTACLNASYNNVPVAFPAKCCSSAKGRQEWDWPCRPNCRPHWGHCQSFRISGVVFIAINQIGFRKMGKIYPLQRYWPQTALGETLVARRDDFGHVGGGFVSHDDTATQRPVPLNVKPLSRRAKQVICCAPAHLPLAAAATKPAKPS